MFEIVKEDIRKLTKTQQIKIKPELDSNLCMFSSLQPVIKDTMIIRSKPEVNTETYFKAGILKLPIAVLIIMQLTTITTPHFSTIVVLPSHSITIRLTTNISNNPTRDIITYLKYEC